ncbi:Cell division control 48-E-like protein [Hordeum vulgare]|nr:Cell division control 48-E-like protein [Hordeum vulgare]
MRSCALWHLLSQAVDRIFFEAGAKEEESYVKGNFGGSGEDSEGLLHADDEVQADSDDGMVSLKQLPPYVGMKFDTLDDAEKFYNDYDFKLGLRTHILSTKFNQ